MIEYIYVPLIILLYFRTWKYKQLMDDPVPRDGMMYTIVDTKIKDLGFYKKQRPIMATVTNIGVFVGVCCYLHYLFGWKVALLYAVMPLNVAGVAWTTGNYYMTSVLLLLFAHLVSTFKTGIMSVDLLRMGVESIVYAVAMNSTLSSIPYLLVNPTIFNFISFITFIFGKRMKTGLSERKKKSEKIKVKMGQLKLETLLNVPKTLGYYIFLSFWPSRLGFFHGLGRSKEHYKAGFIVTSGIICLLFGIFGYLINWKYVFCWFLFMGIFSQFVIFGQYTAERYLFIPNIFFCLILCSWLSHEPILYTILVTLWAYRSHIYIKCWESNGTLFTESSRSFPKAPENFNNLANLYMDDNRFFDAARPLLMALENTLSGKYNIYCNLSVCYANCGMFDKAYHYATLALNDPNGNIEQRPLLEKSLKDYEARIKKINSDKKYLKDRGII